MYLFVYYFQTYCTIIVLVSSAFIFFHNFTHKFISTIPLHFGMVVVTIYVLYNESNLWYLIQVTFFPNESIFVSVIEHKIVSGWIICSLVQDSISVVYFSLCYHELNWLVHFACSNHHSAHVWHVLMLRHLKQKESTCLT